MKENSIFLSVCLSVYLSIYLSIYLSFFLSFYMSVCLFIYISIDPPTFLSFFLSIFLSICLSFIYLSLSISFFYLSIYPSITFFIESIYLTDRSCPYFSNLLTLRAILPNSTSPAEPRFNLQHRLHFLFSRRQEVFCPWLGQEMTSLLVLSTVHTSFRRRGGNSSRGCWEGSKGLKAAVLTRLERLALNTRFDWSCLMRRCSRFCFFFF